MNNSFARYGDSIYKQTAGIPQGNNASPLLADLTLAYMEYKYIMANQDKFRKFNVRSFRYMDDLLIIYKPDQSQTVENFSDIYDNQLQLEKTNESVHSCNYLDLNITIDNMNKVCITKLYNKTDDYQFKIQKYPHYQSNIPLQIGLNTITGELIRFSRSCSKVEDFLDRADNLIQDYKSNEFPPIVIINRILRVIKNNELIKYKYNPAEMNKYCHSLKNKHS